MSNKILMAMLKHLGEAERLELDEVCPCGAPADEDSEFCSRECARRAAEERLNGVTRTDTSELASCRSTNLKSLPKRSLRQCFVVDNTVVPPCPGVSRPSSPEVPQASSSQLLPSSLLISSSLPGRKLSVATLRRLAGHSALDEGECWCGVPNSRDSVCCSVECSRVYSLYKLENPKSDSKDDEGSIKKLRRKASSEIFRKVSRICDKDNMLSLEKFLALIKDGDSFGGLSSSESSYSECATPLCDERFPRPPSTLTFDDTIRDSVASFDEEIKLLRTGEARQGRGKLTRARGNPMSAATAWSTDSMVYEEPFPAELRRRTEKDLPPLPQEP
ncbi:hypothetical protein M422DRAFT_25047, partial [Sphaerobolus stellatus SS14]